MNLMISTIEKLARMGISKTSCIKRQERSSVLAWVWKLELRQKALDRVWGHGRNACPVGAGSTETFQKHKDKTPGSIPGSERSPGDGNGYPLQYSCLENSMVREPGPLQSMGSQRVRPNWQTNTCTFFFTRGQASYSCQAGSSVGMTLLGLPNSLPPSCPLHTTPLVSCPPHH